ncbi:hypothetical protein GUJ93_ZPchr0013g37411 [Zizania palustris]|uniref:Uncharacterized protein n=1 Tax=Zizania palustris TaxID=103762 RepID=A0A8J6BZ31_ZIZPA|nr:hypothetical protein GUJ93_ZPchr0013g37411 [Zizania palustris]
MDIPQFNKICKDDMKSNKRGAQKGTSTPEVLNLLEGKVRTEGALFCTMLPSDEGDEPLTELTLSRAE